MRPLASRLKESGIDFVQSSLAAYGNHDWAVFMLHAGTSLEHLLKAVIAERNPLLLAERKVPDIRRGLESLLWLSDESLHGSSAPSRVRTLGALDCLVIARAVGVPVDPHQKAAEDLLSVRNGAAHLGVGDHGQAEELLPGFLILVGILGSQMGIGPKELFGSYAEFAAIQVDEHRKDVERRLLGLIEHAKVRFAEQYGSADDAHLKDLRRMIESGLRRTDPDDQIVDCPACQFPCLVMGELEITDWEVEYDRDGFPEGRSPIIDFFAYRLMCGVCGLELDDNELVNLSDALKWWSVPDADYERLMQQYYDDERWG